MDTIAQFLTVIRNAGTAGHEKVDLPSSKIRVGIAEILVKEGYIRSYKVAKDSRQGIMRIYLRYDDKGQHAIQSIDRVSRPGKRIYIEYSRIPQVRSGFGICILSTSKGIIGTKQAVSEKLGGELLCTVW